MLVGLENNLWLKFLSNLPLKDLRSMSLVNKRFAELIRQKPLWWNLMAQHFHDLTQKNKLTERQLQQYQDDPQALFVALSAEYKGVPLWMVAGRGHTRLVQALLAEVREKISRHDIGFALKVATESGHLTIVELLLAQNACCKWYKGQALRKAAISGHLPIVEVLLAHVINGDDEGVALYNAAYYGHLSIVELLLNQVGHEITAFNKGMALRNASLNDNRDIVDLLLKKVGKQISSVHKGLALVSAINGGHPDIAEVFLSQIGDDISVHYKVEALSIAALKRSQTSMSLLLERCGHEMSFIQLQSAIGFIPACQIYISRAFNALRGMMGAVPMVLTQNPPETNQAPLLLVEAPPQRFPFADEQEQEEIILKRKVDQEEDEELIEEVAPSHKRRKVQGG